MPIERINFDDIAEADLQELIDVGVPEGLNVEYKRELYDNTDADKKEVLKDITSFANSSGGHLIIGVEEEQGLPTNIRGIGGVDVDAAIQRIENLIRDGVEPRMVGVRIKSVPLQNGDRALLLRIPKNWNPPHRVSVRNHNRFYLRNSAGAHEASVEELRQMFGASTKLEERIRDFRIERIDKIKYGNIGFAMAAGPMLDLHIVPLASLGGGARVDLEQALQLHRSFRPIGTDRGFTPRFNFDGFCNFRAGQSCHGYTQIFRNGILEASYVGIAREREGKLCLIGSDFGRKIFDVLPDYVGGLGALGVPMPFVVMLTLTEIRGSFLISQANPWFEELQQIQRDDLPLPEIVINDFGTPEDYQRAMRPALDVLRNAAGYSGCNFFNEEGHWIGH